MRTKLLISLEKELLDRIEEHRYKNRIPSRAEAMRSLMVTALDKAAPPPTKRKVRK
jgi:metal-responsive CopG/Arc/MetJ family transcriptional regulator